MKVIWNSDALSDFLGVDRIPPMEIDFPDAPLYSGGWDHVNSRGLNVLRDMSNNRNGGLACYKKYGGVPNQENSNIGWKTTKRFNGRLHTEESKRMIGAADRTGSKNSQFGSMWITDGSSNRKCKGTIPPGWYRGRVNTS